MGVKKIEQIGLNGGTITIEAGELLGVISSINGMFKEISGGLMELAQEIKDLKKKESEEGDLLGEFTGLLESKGVNVMDLIKGFMGKNEN